MDTIGIECYKCIGMYKTISFVSFGNSVKISGYNKIIGWKTKKAIEHLKTSGYEIEIIFTNEI